MKRKLNILGIIPARGGSKGIKKKNLSNLNGKPLIEYTIIESLKSKLITDLIVSSDDREILKTSERLGIISTIVRPKKLSLDKSPSFPVILHALNYMQKKEKKIYDYIVMLQPTAPLRKRNDIDNSLKKLIYSNSDSIVSVVDVGAYHPLRMKRIIGVNRLINLVNNKSEDMRPRQDLPPVYIRNGAIYAIKSKVLKKEKSLVGKRCIAYKMPKSRSVNIDEPLDLITAKYYLKNSK
tara:strand:+ start:8312 stop:9022 length:711 start_codon:yes stop_codon:yes gene_type:complete